MSDLAFGLTGTERAAAKTATRLLAARPASPVDPHARLAGALRALAADKKDEADFLATVPVVSLDEWAVAHAPDLIREAETASGVPHWTTRQRRNRLVAAGIRRGYRPTATDDYDPWSAA